MSAEPKQPQWTGPITRDADGRPQCVLTDRWGWTVRLVIGKDRIDGYLGDPPDALRIPLIDDVSAAPPAGPKSR